MANVDIEWHRLHVLQDLSICRVRLQLGQGIVGLLQLHHLRHISFAGSSVHSDKDRECFAGLMHTFARLRPEVKLAFYSKIC